MFWNQVFPLFFLFFVFLDLLPFQANEFHLLNLNLSSRLPKWSLITEKAWHCFGDWVRIRVLIAIYLWVIKLIWEYKKIQTKVGHLQTLIMKFRQQINKLELMWQQWSGVTLGALDWCFTFDQRKINMYIQSWTLLGELPLSSQSTLGEVSNLKKKTWQVGIWHK